nr:retrovirus-related Pol polyprotein from transposon TNT 1-94 [Tanacetum cinerariifolium]
MRYGGVKASLSGIHVTKWIKASTLGMKSRVTMVTKLDIDKFDGKIPFAIWKVRMQVVLTHHGYKNALRGLAHKPQSMSDEDWLELDEKALATIQHFLTREVLREMGMPTQYLCDVWIGGVHLPSICVVIGADGYA